METNAENALELFSKTLGQEEGSSPWHTITQKQINEFGEATQDKQFIHVDPKLAAKASPYKVTIAHGFLTLSMVTYLTAGCKRIDSKAYEGVVMGVNYGLNKVRFPSPVKVESRIRASRALMSAEQKDPNTLQLTHKVTIEIEGNAKPGCVAEFITRLIYA